MLEFILLKLVYHKGEDYSNCTNIVEKNGQWLRKIRTTASRNGHGQAMSCKGKITDGPLLDSKETKHSKGQQRARWEDEMRLGSPQ